MQIIGSLYLRLHLPTVIWTFALTKGNRWCFFDVISRTHVSLFFSIPTRPLLFLFQDENATAQGVLAVHGGPVRHLLPPLLQGPPLCLPAA